MKKTLFFIFLLAISALLISCSFSAAGQGGDDNNAPPDDTRYDGYVIIAPKDQIEIQYMSYTLFSLRDGLKSAANIDAKSISDTDSYNGLMREILVGDTNRDLSDEAFALIPESVDGEAHVFSVLAKDGNIAIAANTESAYKIASKWLARNFFAEDMPKEYSKVMFTTADIYAVEGNESTCYDISKLYSDIYVSAVELDGVTLESFDAGVTEYDVRLSVRDAIPTVTVKHPAFVECVIDTAQSSATATLTSMDKNTVVTYTFNFIKEEVSAVNGINIEKVWGGRDAIVVIVHDDGTKSTVNYLADQFARNDLLGTIGLIANRIATQSTSGNWSLNNEEVSYWQNVLKTGHFDIANHSLTHKFWGISNEAESGYYLDGSGNVHEYSYEAGRITDEVVLSKQLLKEAFPSEDIMAFIKPGFGRVTDENGTTGMTQISDVAYGIIAEHYIGMRDTGGGVTEIPVPNILKVSSHTVRASDTSAAWSAEVKKAMNQNGMIVFLFHTIVDEPAEGSLTAKTSETDSFFEWLGGQKADGKVWNAYLDDAMRYVEEYKYASLDAKDFGDRIELTLTDGLDDEIYNHPLTINVPIDTRINSITAEHPDGTIEELEITEIGNNRYILIDIVPDSGTVVLHTN